MITHDHLEMIRVYLTPELPPPYNSDISIDSSDIVINLPNGDEGSFVVFEYKHRLINDSLSRIRSIQGTITIFLKTDKESRSFQININTSDNDDVFQ